MACFVVPAAGAAVSKIVESGVKKKEMLHVELDKEYGNTKIKLSTKLSWLTNLLCGGAALLAFEHVWHGEVTPWFPFLTAMTNSDDAILMFHEMSTVGVSMAFLIVVIWGIICFVADNIVESKNTNIV